MRLQKFLADAGVASRRKAEALIAAGRVAINGEIAALGAKVAEGDSITLDGAPVAKPAEKFVYILLNKPAGVICSAKDQFGRQTVVDFVENVGARLYPVGRLDFHSTGLVLLTNDGDLAYKLTHPKHGHIKTYTARVKNPIKPEHIQDFRCGMVVDGYKTKPAGIEILDKWGKQAKITLSEGRNRQIRKMFEAQGNEIVSLKRVAMGKIELGELKSGAWRHLRAQEVADLRGEGK
ncbi:MAG: rRNA pseudouridine synthase [Clostridiales bacterium]|jgi:23S rRNA pseudouridine2605 synthase|nr:rRNA pseudouridine synthase [Clostridiales bacterium]